MRKPDFAYAKTKAQISCAVTAQLILCSNCTADQGLCFRYTARTIPLLLKSKSCFQPTTVQIPLSDLVGNPDDRFSCVAARIVSEYMGKE